MTNEITVEEAVKQIKENCYFASISEKTKQALDMAIKALEQPSVTAFADKCRECGKIFNDKLQMKWIPVSERLPEPNVAVLTYINTGATETYCLAYWNDRCEAWEEWIGIDLIEKDKGYKVMAWRELPEPY